MSSKKKITKLTDAVEIGMTAVILNWKREDNLRIIIRQLKKKTFYKRNNNLE